MFSSTVIFTDGIRCQIQGNGNPNDNHVTLATGCAFGIYFDDAPTRQSHISYVWNGTSWINL